MMEEASESNLVIVRKKQRCFMFLKIYWRNIFVSSVVLLLLPIAFIQNGDAYKCFYIFLVTAILWVTDALHPVAVSFIPIGFATLFAAFGSTTLYQIQLRNRMLDCLGALILIEAIEYSKLHKRVALKMLLSSGCSHYRLSFILFFASMFLAMWISSTITCSIMMPTVKAILFELEKVSQLILFGSKLGTIEVYHIVGAVNAKRTRHEQRVLKPTRFTVFYFLGIAYSVSIGELCTFVGSEANQIFRVYCEIIFPHSPKIEFPQFLLLNLPSVLLIETLVYLWMNFYFLGMFRQNAHVIFQTSISEDEARYIDTLLDIQYEELGKITYHEIVVGTLVLLTAILQATLNYPYYDQDYSSFQKHIKIMSPSLICVILLFMIPIDMNFFKFFQKSEVIRGEPLPKTPSKACLSWAVIREKVHWSILFIIGGSMATFEALKDSDMTSEFEAFLAQFAGWPAAALLLVVMLFSKLMAEFACSPVVVYCLLPHVAKVSIMGRVNPHYLLVGAALCCSLSFHLVTGAAHNAMVASYVHISHWQMIKAGIGPSLISITVIWFAITLWAKAIWTDIYAEPSWAYSNVFQTQGIQL